MRCYFLNDGHIAGVEILPPGLSDKNAVARAHMLSLKHKGLFDGFEVWHRNRMVFRHPNRPVSPTRYDLSSAILRMTSL
jgi:hypothetical protein